MTGSDPGARARVFDLAIHEGFSRITISAAVANPVIEEAAQARLANGDLAGMGWMTSEWITRAADPQAFLPGAKSVILLALAYPRVPPPRLPEAGAPARGRIAAYAQGRDYHRVFEKKLRRMAKALREEFGAEARPTVDYGPLLERPLGAASGMGWQGKSTMLLVPRLGPWVMLGAIATTLDLGPGEPVRKSCGSCTRCVTACPTGALGTDGSVLDARKCISYHTIENRGAIPRDLRGMFGDWIFGCDACLESCPVGAGGNEVIASDLAAREGDEPTPVLTEVLSLTEESFRERYQGRAIMRAKRDGLVRNACVALGNVGTAEDFDALVGALGDESALVRRHAAWAIGAMAERFVGLRDVAANVLEQRMSVESDEFVREEIAEALEHLRREPRQHGGDR